MLAAAALFAASSGCAPRETRFHIVDYREGGAATRYTQAFEDCYFRFDGVGQLDIVARHQSSSSGGPLAEQIVHIRTFWLSRPGQTEADATMINATVSYMITSAATGATFEGSGFLSFNHDRRRDRIRAHLELSSLLPLRRVGSADRLFDRAELSGALFARRDDARVVSILNESRRLFGPLPDYHPPQG
ncbi:MAG: hypothetical protein HOP29_07215, partial [Phycisphaerales bacterium]|nr:hypothetical protein [Phycisphaerales bacterium]